MAAPQTVLMSSFPEVKAMRFGKHPEFVGHLGRYTNNSECLRLSHFLGSRCVDPRLGFPGLAFLGEACHLVVRPSPPQGCQWTDDERTAGAVSSQWLGVLIQGRQMTKMPFATWKHVQGFLKCLAGAATCATLCDLQALPRAFRRWSRTAAQKSRLRMLSAGAVQARDQA